MAAGLLAIVSACGAKLPPPAVGPPRFPDFIEPSMSPPDARLAALDMAHHTGWRSLQAGDLDLAEREFQAVLKRSPSFNAFYDALPVGGVDGTIRNRMRGTPAEGNVHAKTGSMSMARSLSGYVTTADRRLLIFSFLCNNWTVPVRSVERVQDAILARLAGMRLR